MRAWLAELELNGFVILRGFLPVDLVRGMRRQLAPILEGELARTEKGDTLALRGPRRLSFDVGRYAELLGGPLADDRFRRHPVIEELAAAVLGPRESWGRGWTRCECCWSGSAHMGWHTDQVADETPRPDALNRTVRLAYNIPLTDWTADNGAMEILPGSHRLPWSVSIHNVADVAHLYPARPDLRVGDALLRDGHALHRGTPNRTAEPRAMLDQTYRSAKSPAGQAARS